MSTDNTTAANKKLADMRCGIDRKADGRWQRIAAYWAKRAVDAEQKLYAQRPDDEIKDRIAAPDRPDGALGSRGRHGNAANDIQDIARKRARMRPASGADWKL